MKNSYVGSAVERREDLRFVRGRGQYVDDLAPDGLLHAVILRSSVAHGRIRSIDAAAALRIVGVHAVITARDMPGGPPRIAMRLQPLPEFKPFEQSVIADAEVRYVGEPIAVLLATSIAVGEDALDPHRGGHRTAPGRQRLRNLRQRRPAAVSGTGHQLRHDIHGGVRRCRCGFRNRPLRATGEIPHRPALRPHHGAARRDGRMGRRNRPADGVRGRQGAVLQPADSRQADGPAGRCHRDGGERRRRRLRGARRVLPRGFSHPVRGASRRAAGEVDRGSARKPDGHEPRAAGASRCRNRLHARRHDAGIARPRRCGHGRLHAHQRRGRGPQHRTVHGRAISDREHQA